ncbi:DegT/DnrJ/EryC1/StrS family aminotransferase [Streptomyces sp. NPDC054949]
MGGQRRRRLPRGCRPPGRCRCVGRTGTTTEQVYPHAVPDQPALREIVHRTTDITVTLDVLPRTVCLPLAPELTDAEADRVIEAVHGFLTPRV